MSNENFNKVEIRYNPYRVDTEVTINGIELSKECRLSYTQNKRLQHYISKNNEWKGFISEVHSCVNDDKIEIIFEGRAIDFEDLEDSIEVFREGSPNVEIKLELKEFFSDDEMLEKVKKFYEDIQAGPMKELKTNDIKESFKNALKSEFHVNVIGTMSSGKSTLINSMVGKDLLPSESDACTARVTMIKDVKNGECKDFYISGQDKKIVTEELLNELNRENNEGIIEIEGPILGISSEKINLVLLDTPGPNSSQNEKHKELTDRIINDPNKNMVIYVLNATQFGINDDFELLKNISKYIKNNNDKESKDRFIFVLNKCDDRKPLTLGSIAKLLEETKEYLGKHAIHNPNIIPVSAELAKLIRMHKNGIELSIEQDMFFEKYKYFNKHEELQFEKHSIITQGVRKIVNERLESVALTGDEFEEALLHSGIPVLEETINEYLDKYAYPIKIKKAMNSFESKLKELEMLRNLEETMAKSKEDFERIRKEIGGLELKKNDYLNAQGIKEKINELGIDDSSWDSLDRKLVEQMDSTTNEVEKHKDPNMNNKIKATYSDEIINNFKKSVEKIEKEQENDIRVEVQKVKSLAHIMFDQYNKYIRRTFEELSFENFNIEKMDSVSKILIDENKLKNMIEESKTLEYISKTEIVERKKYSPLRWFFDDYYEKKVTIEEEYVDLSHIIEGLATSISIELGVRVDKEKINCEEQLKDIKNEFSLRLDCLDKAIKDVINTLKEKNENYESSKDIFESKEKQYKWLKDILETFDNIINMKEGL